MSNRNGISQQEFENFKKLLQEAEYVTKEVPLSAFKIEDKGLTRNEILINGQPAAVSSNFFTRLANMLKLNAGLTKDMLKNEDGRMAVALMNGLKDYYSANGGKTVMLIADPRSRQIIDICDPKRFRRLTNESVLDITSRIINDNPNVTISSIDLNPHSGKVAINLLNNEEIGFSQAGPDEFFKFGFSIVQTTRGTHTEAYNSRLVCSNGMRSPLGGGSIGGPGGSGPRMSGGFSLRGTSADEIRNFLDHVDQMKKVGFVPSQFENTIREAQLTPASLAEVQSAMHLVTRKIVEEIPDLKKQVIEGVTRKHFAAYADAVSRLSKKGYEVTRFNEKQLANIRTDIKVWELVNELTYLGSNRQGFELANAADLKFEGGKLFAKGYENGFDMQYARLATL